MLLAAIIGEISYTKVPLIGLASMVTRAELLYTRDYLTPGICSLIKPATMENLMSFLAKIYTVIS